MSDKGKTREQPFIEEFNDNYNKSRIGSRLIDVLQTILESKENSRMAKKNKLTKEQKEEIKNRIGEPVEALGKEFGVSAATISYHQSRAKKSGKRPAQKVEESKPEIPPAPPPKKDIKPQIIELPLENSRQKIRITIEIN